MKVKDIILCDDIRTEDNKKLIFIGVYPAGDVIIMGKMPYVFPKLSFAIKIAAEKGEYEFYTSLKNPDQNKIIDTVSQKTVIEADKKEFLVMLSIVGLKIEKTGEYTFEIYEGKKLLEEYKFQVSHKP